uniref:G-protein coupled receptors family 1 profile domain-containing protein n=1 Tax=Pyxicephalus adspersus TaxID=30357 RepID=A0AAV3AH60_PYXAD|nr:TPA: hypothetical protein GDO54_010244 [Pyxicephalus adspersus]
MESFNQTSVTEFIFMAFTKSTRYPALLTAIFLLIYGIIICGNILMILVIKVDSRLHTPMYFFVFNISYLDICYTTTIVPQTVRNLLSSKPSISPSNCAIQMFFVVMLGAVQIVIITIMAYDRYVAICNPLHYKTMMSWPTCIMFICLAYIISFMLSFVMVMSVFSLPYSGKAEIQHFYCDVGQILVLSTAEEQRHFVVELITFCLGLGLFTIPFLLMVISYMFIISAVLKIRTNEGHHKAFSTCSSHITVVVVEYCCLGFMYFRPKTAYGVDKDKVFVLIFTYATPILNPVIYTLRNKAVKQGFWKLTSTKLC